MSPYWLRYIREYLNEIGVTMDLEQWPEVEDVEHLINDLNEYLHLIRDGPVVPPVLLSTRHRRVEEGTTDI
jgi:hypothetical protein